jgi:hypothetical protein
MLCSVLIILFSAALVIYWLHYTCLLLVKDVEAQKDLPYPLFSFRGSARSSELGRATRSFSRPSPAITRCSRISSAERRWVLGRGYWSGIID